NTDILKSESYHESPFGELYPNPAYTEINIPVNDRTLLKDGMVNVVVYSIEGKKVLEKGVSVSGIRSLISLPVNRLIDGAYFCEITNGGNKVVRKFVKHAPNA